VFKMKNFVKRPMKMVCDVGYLLIDLIERVAF
jgi:hypothetical protein